MSWNLLHMPGLREQVTWGVQFASSTHGPGWEGHVWPVQRAVQLAGHTLSEQIPCLWLFRPGSVHTVNSAGLDTGLWEGLATSLLLTITKVPSYFRDVPTDSLNFSELASNFKVGAIPQIEFVNLPYIDWMNLEWLPKWRPNCYRSTPTKRVNSTLWICRLSKPSRNTNALPLFSQGEDKD